MGCIIGYFFWQYRTDDPFITYRYARNLALGNGFVYNTGEHVLGVTNPLYTLMMAIIYKLGLDMPVISTIISVVSWAGVSILTYILLLSWGQKTIALITSFLLMTQPTFIWGIGLESNFSLLLILLGFYGYFKDRLYFSGLFISLAILNRPDSIIVPFLLVAHYLYTKRKFPWGPFILMLILLVPWFLFSRIYFGSFTPNTLQAKMAQGRVGTWFLGWGNFFPAFIKQWGLPFAPIHYNQYILILCTLGLIYCTLYFRKPLLIFLWSFLYFISYSILNIPGSYLWYYIPVIFGMMVMAGYGIYWLAQIIVNKTGTHNDTLIWLNRLLIILFMLLALRWQYRFMHQVYDWNIKQSRFILYTGIADALKSVGHPDNTVACTEIGIIGYYSNFRMIDPCGLVTPEVVPHIEKDFWWSYRELKPDYVVHYDKPDNMPDWFKAQYEVIKTFPTPKHLFNNQPVILYKRKSNIV